MFSRICAVAALALLSASCVTDRAPRIAYACTAELANEHGVFTVTPHELRWRYDAGDGIVAAAWLPNSWQSYDSILANGFQPSERVDAPALVVSFSGRDARNDWNTQPPTLNVAGEIRIGAKAERDWVTSTQSVVFSYLQWHGLLSEAGDMEVLLYRSPSRERLQNGAIPRATLESIEPNMQRLILQLRDMERDPPRNCTPYEEEEIIVT